MAQQTRLPTPALLFSVGVVALLVAMGYRYQQLQHQSNLLRIQQEQIADAEDLAYELQVIVLRLVANRANPTVTHAALSARLQRSASNPMLTSSSAAKRMAEILSGSQLSASEFLGLIGRLQVDLHGSTTANHKASLATAASARQDLVVLGGLLALLALIYAISTYRQSRQVAKLAATAREIRGGDLAVRAPTNGSGEAAELAVDFNEMVEILVDSLAQEAANVTELQKRAKELEEANRHKSRFIANVSHELKTPLSAVIGFTEILESGMHGPLTEKQTEYVSRIADAGDHLRTMISDLIDAARIDMAVLKLHPKDISSTKTLESVVQMLETDAKKKSVTIFIEKSADSALFHDPARLKQILINLIGNALKFTPESGRVLITSEKRGERFAFSVEDEGPGVPKADRERIFQDFVQLDDELHRRHEGTGMGLAISKRLADLMGGTLKCTASKTTNGARFTLDIPLRSSLVEEA